MKFKLHKKRELTRSQKKLIFYYSLLLISCTLWIIAGVVNTGFDTIFSNYSIVIDSLSVPKISVMIAPIVEECIKFAGYGILFLFSLKLISKLEYASKEDFFNDNFVIAFLISTGGFGFVEGFSHNLGFGTICFIAFISLNTFIHITFSIYPFILGRKYRNWFVCFLPIAMLLHAVHNFMIDVVWNNKWVTFSMVTIFFIPILFLERKNLYRLLDKLELSKKVENPRKANITLMLLFLLIYIYIFLCCWLRF